MAKGSKRGHGKKTAARPTPKASLQEAEELFGAGLLLLRQGKTREAMRAFRRAFEMDPSEPRYKSYFGLCIAAAEKRTKQGLRLCEQAAEEEFYRPELFLNLGKVCMIAGNRDKAQRAFRKGLALDRNNKEILQALEEMGTRKQPVFPFLNRRNALNRVVGKVRHKLTG